METVNVAAAVLMKNGRFLIAQRPKEAHQGLKWEFPGGKIEAGEDVASCLKREIKEELDLDISVGEEIIVVEHQYGDKKVILHSHWCNYLGGETTARHCHDFRWVKSSEMHSFDFSEADCPVLKILKEKYSHL